MSCSYPQLFREIEFRLFEAQSESDSAYYLYLHPFDVQLGEISFVECDEEVTLGAESVESASIVLFIWLSLQYEFCLYHLDACCKFRGSRAAAARLCEIEFRLRNRIVSDL